MGAVAKRGETAAETINFRLRKAKKALIDEAANALGKKRSVFMLDALSEKAREVLADRTRFELGQRQAQAASAREQVAAFLAEQQKQKEQVEQQLAAAQQRLQEDRAGAEKVCMCVEGGGAKREEDQW